MKSVPAGQFKQTCLKLLDEVRETRKPLLVTKRGRPVAKIVPVPEKPLRNWTGSMAASCTILGDLVAPTTSPEDWAVSRP